MTAQYIMPESEAMVSLLSIIFGDDVEVGNCDTPDFTDQYQATFIDPEDKLVALCYSDIDFVAYSGSALSMIPAGAAEDMIAEKDISDTIALNFHEVMNICSQLLMNDNSPHLRLDKTFGPGGSDTDQSALADPVVASMYVDVPRYGKGTLSFVIT